MEEDLDKIAHGELERDTLLRAFHTIFEKDLDAFRGEAKTGWMSLLKSNALNVKKENCYSYLVKQEAF